MKSQNHAGLWCLPLVWLSVGFLTSLACVRDHETSDTKETVPDSASVSSSKPISPKGNADERVGESLSQDVIRRATPLPRPREREAALKSPESRLEATAEKTKENVDSITEVETTESMVELTKSDIDRSNFKSTEAWTAMDQGKSRSDVAITRSIRRRVSGDSNLSVYAKNIVVITKGGIVALKGIVRSDAEKAQAERIARDVEGVADVSNHLNIRPR